MQGADLGGETQKYVAKRYNTIQRHEFEGLLFSDVNAFSVLPGVPRDSVVALGNIRSRFQTPEDINDNKNTAPGKRVMKIIPRYRKPLHGPWVAKEIGLGAIPQSVSAI